MSNTQNRMRPQQPRDLQSRGLLVKVTASAYCQRHDLVDPITMLIATGLRRSELLGLVWRNFDETAGTIAVSGKVVRVAGKGLVRVDQTKSDAGRRTISLPKFAVDTLAGRRGRPWQSIRPHASPCIG